MGGKSKELFQNERDEITTYNVQFWTGPFTVNVIGTTGEMPGSKGERGDVLASGVDGCVVSPRERVLICRKQNIWR